MKAIRLHGIGGQGVVMAGEMLVVAFAKGGDLRQPFLHLVVKEEELLFLVQSGWMRNLSEKNVT